MTQALRPGISLVGWFTRRKGGPEVTRLHNVIAAAISRQRDGTWMAAAPVIRKNDRTYIGGPNWYRVGTGHSLRYVNAREKGCSPAGWLRNLEAESGPTAFGDRPMDLRLREIASELFDWYENEAPGLPDSGVILPDFQAPAQAPSGLFTLRHGQELQSAVARCVGLKKWSGDNHIVGLTAPDRGSAKVSEDGLSILCQHGAGEEAICDRFYVNDVSLMAEEAIGKLFGVSRGVEMVPAIPAGKEVRVTRGQALFQPAAEVDPHALEFLAAIASLDEIEGRSVMNDQLVVGGIPYIDLRNMPFSVIVNKRGSLREETSAVSVDLFNVPHRAARRRIETVKRFHNKA